MEIDKVHFGTLKIWPKEEKEMNSKQENLVNSEKEFKLNQINFFIIIEPGLI